MQLQATFLDRLHMSGPANERDRMAGAREHGAEKTADSTTANDNGT
jgi:hypothetical protein